ncbi:precorrin-8X methylmutase [Alkalibaculum sp. M08DMB]|uniref:Precorrin-8X methylmutase n=1 Tax=Alkalibaculum sporogenes TaxID=2655001 RepID=A0A6A7KA97_9FIRM|nr:precorrin-8X methylmutase [Alkalibaculum sporogenes]MPW26282.1 precorrin-8X methylmutase [Alkalibaculum sporogenes]
MQDYIAQPMEIEKKSFEIIFEEMDKSDKELFSVDELQVIKRVIHTSADFEYSKITKFINEPIENAKKSIKSGNKVYVDTNMIKSGINKRVLERFGCEMVNYVSDEDVREEAQKRETTRSVVSIEKACKKENIKMFIIGNAPTALFSLMNMIEEGFVKPDFVIAVPVGFVGAAESKFEFSKLNVPSVVVQGRKGGSTIGVAIFNAILYMMDNNR